MAFDFKGRAAANAWKAELEQLNDQAASIMKGASACMEEINRDSAGGFVDELVKTGSEMVVSTNQMVSAFNGLADAIVNVIALMERLASGLFDAVTGNKSAMTK